MAISSSTSSDYASLFKANDPYSQLIDNLITLDSTQKNKYVSQKQTEQNTEDAISDVSSDMSALNTLLTNYVGPLANQLEAPEATSSNPDSFSVTAGDGLETKGDFSISIQNIAHNDTRYTAQFSTTGTDIVDQLTDASQPGSFEMTAGGNTYTIQAGDLTGMDNEDALSAIASAINSVAGDSVNASIVHESSGTVRLSVRSLESGSANQISFQNTADAANPAEILGFTNGSGSGSEGQDNTALISGTAAGRVYDTDDLDAHFTMDGLSYTRSSNKVDDAITGLTINLLAPTTGSDTITIGSDSDQGKQALQDFIDAYNKLNSDIRSKSSLDPDTGERGPLGNDRTFKNLMYTLQNAMIQTVSTSGDYTNIFSIGLNFQQDGTLYIEDESKLDEALKNDPDAVQKLFSNDSGSDTITDGDGLAKRLQSQIDSYVKAGGVIDEMKSSVEARISQLDDQISQQDDYLAMKRKIYEQQYTQLEQLSNTATAQFNTIQAIMANTTAIYSS